MRDPENHVRGDVGWSVVKDRRGLERAKSIWQGFHGSPQRAKAVSERDAARRNTALVMQPLGGRQGIACMDEVFEIPERSQSALEADLDVDELLEGRLSFRLMRERDQRLLEIGNRLTERIPRQRFLACLLQVGGCLGPDLPPERVVRQALDVLARSLDRQPLHCLGDRRIEGELLFRPSRLDRAGAPDPGVVVRWLQARLTPGALALAQAIIPSRRAALAP
jgi:hypothetical protein